MKILWIPHTAWHIPQRAHLFCHALSERHEMHVTDCVADFFSPRDYLSRRYLRNFFYRQYKDRRIIVHGIPRFSPALFFPFLRHLNDRLFSRVVNKIIQQYHIDAVVGTFVISPPTAPRLVFDWFDDNVAYWRSYGKVKSYGDEIEKVERAYLKKANAVVTASSVLADKARASAASGPVYWIPNAINLSTLEKASHSNLREQIGAQERLVGMMGNHDKQVELDRFIGAAKLFAAEGVTFLIAGRGRAIKDAQKRVQKEHITNVKFIGFVPSQDVGSLVQMFDVGVCTYSITPGADAGCPMRLLVYSAAGIPAVCTDLEEVRRWNFPNVVLVDDTPEALAQGIRSALRLPRGCPPQIDQFDIKRLAHLYEIVLAGGKAESVTI